MVIAAGDNVPDITVHDGQQFPPVDVSIAAICAGKKA